ncbi:MAG: M1 family metallopeptidase [Candidatus Micrarchaeales archaeon]
MPKLDHQTIGDNLIPINYKLVFTPNFKTFKTTVNEDLRCRIKKPTKTIRLNAKELEFISASVFNKDVQKAKIKFDEKKEIVELSFSKPVKGDVEIAITSVCKNNDGLYGFYRSKYTVGGKEKYLLTSQFEAPNARAAFPCIDEPEFKATFDVSFIIDKEYDAISNMPIKESNSLGNGKKIVRCEKSVKMSTYLLYLFVGNYEYIEDKLGKLLLRAITVPGKKEYARTSLEYAKKFLDWQQNYFGIKFPLPKLDFIGIPDFAAGAMENWGAITFRELQFMISKESSVALKQVASETISHEIVHQWFGDLVTMKWWNDLWLNESFATFLACKAIDEVFPEWDYDIQYVDDTIGAALSADALKTTHPISVRVNSPGEIDAIFDRISYEKGGSLLYMLEDYVGKETFRKGLHHYLSKHAYGNATKEDLWNSIQVQAKQMGKKLEVSKLMHSWVTKSGHPMVDVKKVAGGYSLTQARYTLLEDMADTWPIPIHYLTEGEERTITMSKKSMIIKTNSPFIKLNYGQKGLYRVKYDKQTLARLGSLIKEKKLGPLDAWGIENDLFSLTRSGRIELREYLDFVDKYCFNQGYPLNLTVSGHLGWFFAATYRTKLAKITKGTLVRFNKHLLAEFGWMPKKGEREIDIMLRGGVIASLGLAEEPSVVEKARSLFNDHKKGKEINQNIRSAVYSTVAWNLGSENFDYFLSSYKKAKFPEEQRRLLGVLGGFKDKKTLERALSLTYSKEVRLQDSFSITVRVLGNFNGRDIGWKWTKKNWKKSMKTYDSATHMLARFVENMSGVDTKEYRREVATFFSRKENTRQDIVQALNQTLERIDANIKFRKKNGI